MENSYKQVLVLNQSYEPYFITNWKNAITLWFLNKVDILKSYDDVIHSPSLVVNCPSVIRLKTKIPIRRGRISLTRKNVLRRDGYACQYCGIKISIDNSTIDHIIPRSKGGKTEWGNVVACCSRCNNEKGNNLLDNIKLKLKCFPSPKDPTFVQLLSITEIEMKYPEWLDYTQHLFLKDSLRKK